MTLTIYNMSDYEQNIILKCLMLLVESGDLEGEFHARLGFDESEVTELIDKWPKFPGILTEHEFDGLIINVLGVIYYNLVDYPQKWPVIFDFTIKDTKILLEKLIASEKT